jgi:DHA2 family multidrug resistance protein
LVAAPSGVVAVLLTPVVARLMGRIDARWTATGALLAFGLSFWLRSNYTPDASFGVLVIPLLVQGVAMSAFFVSMITLTLNGVRPYQLPSATGLSNFTRLTAGSFAASITTTAWDRGESLHQNRLAESVGGTDPNWLQAMTGLRHAGFDAAHALGVLNQQFVSQAYLLATLDFFRISALMMFAVTPFIWFMKKAVSGGGPVAAD